MCRLAEIDFEGKYILRMCYFDDKEIMKVCSLFLTGTEGKAGELLCLRNGGRPNRR